MGFLLGDSDKAERGAGELIGCPPQVFGSVQRLRNSTIFLFFWGGGKNG